MPTLPLPESVDIREVGMRDGLQLEAPIPLAAKLEMLEAIIASGVKRVEVTSFVSAKAVPALADADKVAAFLGRWPNVAFSALVANSRGAARAIEAGISRLEYVVSAADSHSLANTRRTTADAADSIGGIAAQVHGVGGLLEVIIATAWDCPFDGPTRPERTLSVVRTAAGNGADQICLGDTIGTTTPARTVALIDAVREAAPGMEIGVHFHDTRGTGQANALAALLNGVRMFDASVGGLGGCPFAPGASGNIATEELVYWTAQCGIESGVELAAVVDAARVAQRAVGHDLTSSLLRAGGAPVPLGAYALP